MIKFLIIFVIAFASVNAFWSACSSGQAPNSVTSPSCSGASCTVTRGSTLTGTINFTPQYAVSSLNAYAIMYYLGAEVDIEISEANRSGEA
jgi:hypothetical protein